MNAGITRRTLIGGAAALPLVPRPSWAATPPPQLSVAAMRDDLTLLERIYTRLHPGLYRYAGARETAARFAAVRDAITTPLPLGEFYLRLSRLLATVRCGHSYANFYNQKKVVRVALFEGDTRLPLHFLWLGERMIVTADPYGTGIAPGSEVLAIDGRPAGAVLAALLPYARADGHNDAKRRRLLSVQGEDGYETFDVFHALHFRPAATFRLQVAGPDGRRRTTAVRAVSLAERRAHRVVADGAADAPIWSMERRGAAAVLTMSNWGLYDAKWDWKAWLDAAVDRLIADRVPALVVDIRHNEGGEDCGNELLARMIERAVPAQRVRRLIRYETLPAEFRPYCDTWDRSFDTLGVGAKRVDDRFLKQTDPAMADDTIRPRGARYPGKLIVLTGPQNSSATFQFANCVLNERLGTLVGEETGGNRRGINGGCFYFVRLPATGLEADLPLIGAFPLRAQPDAGVRPNIAVPLTRAAIAAGSDPALARALALAG